MVNITPGRPFSEVGGPDYPLPDERARTAANRQRNGLVGGARRRAQHLELNRRLIRRRGDRPAGLLKRTDALLRQLIDETGVPLLTLNEIVVRTADYAGEADHAREVSMNELLADFAFTADPVEELDSRVTLLSDPDLSTGELAMVVERLRLAGYQASMNHVTPLGYVTKSDPTETGPEPTERRVGFPAVTRPDGWRDVTVAVVDTGLSDQARDDGWLDGITADAADVDPLYEDDRTATDGLGYFDHCAGHGTFVAGIVRQVAPYATVLARRAVGRDGIGVDVDIAIAVVQAYEAGAEIINLSLGTEMPHDQPPVASMVALEIIGERSAAGGRDVVVVAAAGNNGNRRPVFPAAFSGVPRIGVPVVSVAALSIDHEPTEFSSRGFWVTCSTTGEAVLSTYVRGRETVEIDWRDPDDFTGENPWAVWSGTSFAAPQISGALARRCAETGEGPSAALAWLLRQGPQVPDHGTALEILPYA
jgi:hypothetical protein